MERWFGGPFLVELFMVVLGVAFWVGLIALIVLAIRWLLRQDRAASQAQRGAGGVGSGPPADDPLEILRRRYAAGEIDDEEYQRRRKTLTG